VRKTRGSGDGGSTVALLLPVEARGYGAVFAAQGTDGRDDPSSEATGSGPTKSRMSTRVRWCCAAQSRRRRRPAKVRSPVASLGIPRKEELASARAGRSRFVAPMFGGALDIVGDVHGELAALESLLRALGYDSDGGHPDGRRLVFVGDLTDRGPDSVSVALLVARLVQEGRAQCVAGNHELNLMRRLQKEGNGWFYERNHDHVRGKFPASRPALDHHRPPIADFFTSLPLALERPDLRVVHACWHPPAVEALRRSSDPGILEAFETYSRIVDGDLAAGGWIERRRDALERIGERLYDRAAHVDLVESAAVVEAARQDRHPIRALTSGLEERTEVPFYAGGKWRMVERVRWWNAYEDTVPVVFGHYWRWPTPTDRSMYDRSGPDVFAGTHFTQWLGPAGTAFCIDYSVGRRYVELEKGMPAGSSTKLGALRWPERMLVFETGETYETDPAMAAFDASAAPSTAADATRAGA
jgi:hypothetical protein